VRTLAVAISGVASSRQYRQSHRAARPALEIPALRSEFLRRYYSLRDTVPPRILLDGEIEDAPLLEEWLTRKAAESGARYNVRFVYPRRGEQAQLLAMCRDNAAERVAQQLSMRGRDVSALAELQQLLGLPKPPSRIESYDISHTGGSDVVGAMVVFQNGKPLKSAYRRFEIKTVVGQDDYASMREVLNRRLCEHQTNPNDIGFGELPDLILLDGGKGHVAAVKPLVDGFGYGIPVFGLVKDSHHRTRAITEAGAELSVGACRSAFTLVSAIQDEVHRFAIHYHRQKRRKQATASSLTEIEGVGEKRAALLLRHFGSLRAVREATVDQLVAVKGMTRPTAEKIVAYYQEK
jgi:excinuclease ABC subunit C